MVNSRLAWPASIDVPVLRGEGSRPHPFREFIVKVHSRCDLSCDYCYVYEMADQSWRDQPRAMSDQTADMTARRIGEHARTHSLREITLVMHGGEPLLAGRELISALVTSTRRRAGPGITVHAAVQINGVGVSDAYLDFFDELDIRLFKEIMHLVPGGTGGSETVGLAPAQMVVIETDGAIEQEDSLEATCAGATATTLHVDRDPLDAAPMLPQIAAIRYIKCRVLEDLDAGRARKVD